MFKRIKNLLDISRYTVEEVVNHPTTFFTTSGDDIKVLPNFRPATIINMKKEDPLKDFDDETTEQSLDDTTARNW